MSAKTYRVGAHFKALNETVLMAISKILDNFFPFRVSQPPCAAAIKFEGQNMQGYEIEILTSLEMHKFFKLETHLPILSPKFVPRLSRVNISIRVCHCQEMNVEIFHK